MKANPRTATTILLTVTLLAVIAFAWLWWKSQGDGFSEKRRPGAVTVDTMQEHGAAGTTTSGPALPENDANTQRVILEMRERAAARVEQIRAAQEQLRGGAAPEEVKEPELPGRR